MLLLSILLASALGGVLSVAVAGLLMKGLPLYWLPRMIGFSAGLLLGAATLSVLPEAFEAGADSHTLFAVLLSGFLAFYALQRAMLWRHSHGAEGDMSPHAHGVGRETAMSIVIGDGFHNFVDGVMIAAAFLIDPAVGWATAIAVIAHEIPQEAGDFVVLLSSGLTWRRALALNSLSSLASIVGALAGYVGLSQAQTWLPYALVLAASSFVYIAIADLLPFLRREIVGTQIAWQTSALAAGLAVAALLAGSHSR